jgi:thioredoxin-like negative regulator of GroEL
MWWRGRLAGLPAAVCFALAFNLFLVARYLYPQWIAGGLVSLGFWVGSLVWIFCVVRSIRELPTLIRPRAVSEQPDRFPEARTAYLRGAWAEAEGLLTDVLAIEPRDPPALLLLTGVYRHTGRLEAASILLREIRRLEIADHWWLELDAESRRLEQAVKQVVPESENDESPGSDPGESAADMTAKTRTVA